MNRLMKCMAISVGMMTGYVMAGDGGSWNAETKQAFDQYMQTSEQYAGVIERAIKASHSATNLAAWIARRDLLTQQRTSWLARKQELQRGEGLQELKQAHGQVRSDLVGYAHHVEKLLSRDQDGAGKVNGHDGSLKKGGNKPVGKGTDKGGISNGQPKRNYRKYILGGCVAVAVGAGILYCKLARSSSAVPA